MTIKEYLKKIGRRGGKTKSAEKIAASQANGKLGGRPKNSKPNEHVKPNYKVKKDAD